jgi:hypothetical protein
MSWNINLGGFDDPCVKEKVGRAIARALPPQECFGPTHDCEMANWILIAMQVVGGIGSMKSPAARAAARRMVRVITGELDRLVKMRGYSEWIASQADSLESD